MESLFSRIVVALDGTPAQQVLIHKAVHIAKNQHAEIIFAHVVDLTNVSLSGMSHKMMMDISTNALHEFMDPVLEEIENDPNIPSARLFITGGCNAADVLIDEVIIPVHPDLVICGSRGYNELHYTFVGSTSKQLVHKSPCDVLIIKNFDDVQDSDSSGEQADE
jgi:nucleotide-binding universal stress UspA family protein